MIKGLAIFLTLRDTTPHRKIGRKNLKFLRRRSAMKFIEKNGNITVMGWKLVTIRVSSNDDLSE